MHGGARSPDRRSQLLVIATGMRRFMEYLLAAIVPRYDIHMFLHAEPTWGRDYSKGWTVLESTLDADALVAAGRELAAGQPVDGVLRWDEARQALLTVVPLMEPGATCSPPPKGMLVGRVAEEAGR